MVDNIRFRVFANSYKDSVALMQVGAALRKRPGIAEATCIMATPANLAQLQHAKLTVDADVHPSDLLVVVRGELQACAEAIDAADKLLQGDTNLSAGPSGTFSLPVTSIAAALETKPDVDLALISVPGDYAAAEALKALAAGLHVMLFSDNVAVEEELAIKRIADERGLLVMGPDCGTAIVNGIPLGFANVVRRGPIGLVAASGTGLQEVTCRIHNLGAGVSQALGTGGRDLNETIGGRSMRAGVRALADDPDTAVIVLISKPPAASVAAKVLDVARASGKPTVVHFLGANAESIRGGNLHAAASLAEAADLAVTLATSGGRATAANRDTSSSDVASTSKRGELVDARVLLRESAPLRATLKSSQRLVRGFFTGGTFCYEAQLAFLRRGLRCRSNAPAPQARALDETRADHVFIDMGDDEYTRGRPHPMIDPSLRNAAIRDASHDPAVAIILVDVVLGYGSHPAPGSELADALRDAQRSAAAQGRKLIAIGHVCGTDGDPQNRDAQIDALRSVGTIIADSNIEAASLAAEVALTLAQTQTVSA
jgi:succinyl-CoA synthetase alpha subunit